MGVYMKKKTVGYIVGLAGIFYILYVLSPSMWSVGLPYYGDNLELMWAYNTACKEDVVFPTYIKSVMYPIGYTLWIHPHTMFSMWLLRMFCWAGKDIIALNMLYAFLFFVIFYTSYVIFYNVYDNVALSMIAAAANTFTPFRYVRMSGHVHALVGSIMINAIMLMLMRINNNREDGYVFKYPFILALYWLISSSFSLYFSWISGLVIAIGLAFVDGITLKRKIEIFLSTALLYGILFYVLIFRNFAKYAHLFGISFYDIVHIDSFSVNLRTLFGEFPNSLVSSFIGHNDMPSIYPESNYAMIGALSLALALYGSVMLFKGRHRWIVVVSWLAVILSLGPYLHVPYNSSFVLSEINKTVWHIGNKVKPDVFAGQSPPVYLKNAFPLPALFWIVFFPYSEGFRVISRFLFAGLTGIYMSSGYAINSIKYRHVRILLSAIWLLEVVILPVKWHRLPDIHPVYKYIRSLSNGDSVVTMHGDGIYGYPQDLYAQTFHLHPMINIYGSFSPPHIVGISELITSDDEKKFSFGLQQLENLGADLIILFMDGNKARMIYRYLSKIPRWERRGCFAPVQDDGFWDNSACVFVRRGAGREKMGPRGKVFELGWSTPEDWGIWAVGTHARVSWITQRPPRVLHIEAIPNCVQGKTQYMDVLWNGYKVNRVAFDTCSEKQVDISIPHDLAYYGYNALDMWFSYAISPYSKSNGRISDRRPLSVGFLSLDISY